MLYYQSWSNIMETNENEFERPFVKECNNFIEAKYIMLGCENIKSLLLTIQNDKSLMEVVEKCLVDFDFMTELGKAISIHQTQQKDFIMPKENDEIVALCYCTMQHIVDGEIDFESFMSKCFLFNGTFSDCYANFGHYFILPFKNALLNLENQNKYKQKNANTKSVQEENDEIEVQEKPVNDSEISAKLLKVADDIQEIINNDYKIKEFKLEEIEFYLKAFREAVRINNKLIIFALADAIISSSSKIKSVRFETQRLKDLCNKL